MKRLTTLVSTVGFFVTLGFALESFLLVLLRGNAKIVSKALVPPAVYKALSAETIENSQSTNLSQNAKNLQCLLKFGIIEDNATVFQSL